MQLLFLQVSSDCSAAYVDGSESGVGSTCVKVEFFLGTLRDSLCLTVWAPVVPLQISLSDTVLSPIKGWSYYQDSRYGSVLEAQICGCRLVPFNNDRTFMDSFINDFY